MPNNRPDPTRAWVEDRLTESEIVTDKKIADLRLRIAALEKVVKAILRVSQEEMDRLLEKP